MIFKIPRLPGFGMRPVSVQPSPYAVRLFGPPTGLSRRTRLSLWLIRKDVLQMGNNDVKIDFNDIDMKRAINDTIQAFSLRRRVQPYHLNDVFFLPLDLRKSSPGIPWAPRFKTRGEVMDDPSARQSIRYLWHRIKLGQDLHLPDCKVLYRAHLRDDDTPKLRAIYGYPTTVTLAEAQFALPLIEAFKEGGTPLAYGYDMALGGAMRVRKEIRKYKYYACLDFSKFDKSVSADLIRTAFNILETNIDFRQYKDAGVPDGRKLYTVWEKLIDYFINTTMRMPTGERFKKTAGIPSGSYFTQIIGSIVNHILMSYAHYKIAGTRPQYIRVFGDDSVMGDDQPFKLYQICEVLSKLGMTINPVKSIVTSNLEELEFLGFNLASGFPQRSLQKWMSSLYYPEYPDERWDNFASRALGLFYANAGMNITAHNIFSAVILAREFDVTLSRDFTRYLTAIGIDPGGMSCILPTPRQFMFSLM